MRAAGIIDRTKVLRVALQDAASVVGPLTTTEAMVGDRPEAQGCARHAAGWRDGRHGLLERIWVPLNREC